jgi:hypothetical protein
MKDGLNYSAQSLTIGVKHETGKDGDAEEVRKIML